MNVSLDTAAIEAIAERVADLLRHQPVDGELVDATEIARRFGVTRAYVYEHSDELGAVRLGEGDRPRLRFDPRVVFDHLGPRPTPTAKAPKPRHRKPSTADLLPVWGRP